MDQPLYQIEGRDVIFDWLPHENDPDQRHAMLDWLAGVARRPYVGAQRVPGIRAPVYLAVVPVRPPAVARFLIAEQFRTVRFINIAPMP